MAFNAPDPINTPKIDTTPDLNTQGTAGATPVVTPKDDGGAMADVSKLGGMANTGAASDGSGGGGDSMSGPSGGGSSL